MARRKSTPKEAYVVFKGRTPGLYRTYEEARAQTHGFPNNSYLGYPDIKTAEEAWARWEMEHPDARQTAQARDGASPYSESILLWLSSLPPILPQVIHDYIARALDSDHMRAYVTSADKEDKLREIVSIAIRDKTIYAINWDLLPLPQDILYFECYYSRPLERYDVKSRQNDNGALREISSNLKRGEGLITMLGNDEDEVPRAKRFKSQPVVHVDDFPECEPAPAAVEEKHVELSKEQRRVVDLALERHNIFLTGAAGSGKTVTLKEIIRKLREPRKADAVGNAVPLQVEIVAPTGIAALPLDGKTLHSFAGWTPDSFRCGMCTLLERVKLVTAQRISGLDALIIEEISMVESQWLERLNLLLRHVTQSDLPFGGKQVILLGDFYQLPPVKPFRNCLALPEGEVGFLKSDMWAFKAKIWKELNLKFVMLKQIHRQKDSRFQDILNKIRVGELLSEDEWRDLEREKKCPTNAFPIRLMSTKKSVAEFNELELFRLPGIAYSWESVDACEKLRGPSDGSSEVRGRIADYMKSLKDDRFLADLTLKDGKPLNAAGGLQKGARVVLLQNLGSGLVNGSQGIVVGFREALDEMKMTKQQGSNTTLPFRLKSMRNFINKNNNLRPVVRFANGKTKLISAFASTSIRGGNKIQDQYILGRTQIPLALAWALSIHKSQGMTLEYVEASSCDIFQSGQLYVALSRATHLEGLRVTGFKRRQLPIDEEVVKFYASTKWENLQEDVEELAVKEKQSEDDKSGVIKKRDFGEMIEILDSEEEDI